MKNIIKSALLLLCTIGLFTACNDDREHNPTIQQPKTFVLNTPAYATSLIDLATSSSMTFTWSQPAYGFPAVATYQVQISANNTWTKDIQAGEIDAQKKPVGDYKTFDEEYTTVKARAVSNRYCNRTRADYTLCSKCGSCYTKDVCACTRSLCRRYYLLEYGYR